MEQTIITSKNGYVELDNWIRESHIRSVLLVCGSSLNYHKELVEYIEDLEKKGIVITKFSEYKPNPEYESVEKGVDSFLKNKCDSIIAVGGGSAMDVAKCIKLFSNMNLEKNFLEQEIVPNKIPFLAIPTTAGTGSEATRFAVIYYKGVKQSISDESCIPKAVLMDPSLLKSLPLYQKKATMMDALSHAIESYWSVNSTEESREYSRNAIRSILENMDNYLANEDSGNEGMLFAANLAGRAINITQTTAGHAMCYKLTSLYGISHGHAAIICNRVLYKWMLSNTDMCIDQRGEKYLVDILNKIGNALKENDAILGVKKLNSIVDFLELEIPVATEEQYIELKNSVNPNRLKNFPIKLDVDTIDSLYHDILR